MVLMKDGLWGLMCGTEIVPVEGAEQQAKFTTRKDKALAITVLSIKLAKFVVPDQC